MATLMYKSHISIFKRDMAILSVNYLYPKLMRTGDSFVSPHSLNIQWGQVIFLNPYSITLNQTPSFDGRAHFRLP